MTAGSFDSLLRWIGPIKACVHLRSFCDTEWFQSMFDRFIPCSFFFSDYYWQTWNSSWRCVSWLLVQFWCPPAFLAQIHSVEDMLCATRDRTTKHGAQFYRTARHSCQTARLEDNPATWESAASAPQKEAIILAWFVVHMTISVSFKVSR